ncbi:MAG: TlpA family protein disulfide reductase [Woeseiaceae bacterium]|nr:TlpA family protein disulfide reductase [Woeseiaceae bacterium]
MPRIFLIFAAALVALMAGALFYAARIPIQSPPPKPQQYEQPRELEVVSYPSFSLPDVSGTEHDFSEWAGKNRILNFWATWCAPCRREIPLLKAFQDEQGNNGFQVIGIAVDFPEPVARYAEAVEFNYPILVGEQDAMALAESSGVEFVGLPFTMFVASDGELLGAYIGELHQSHLDTIVEVMTRLDRAEISKEEARSTLQRL